MKHTPGPWTTRNHVEYGNHHIAIDAIEGKLKNLAHVFTTEADSALIAAAPDLLAERDALRARVQELEAELAAMGEQFKKWQALAEANGKIAEISQARHERFVKLVDTAQPRELSNEEIDAMTRGNNYPGTVPGARNFARAVLAAARSAK